MKFEIKIAKPGADPRSVTADSLEPTGLTFDDSARKSVEWAPRAGSAVIRVQQLLARLQESDARGFKYFAVADDEEGTILAPP
jgi:hypothetical protein